MIVEQLVGAYLAEEGLSSVTAFIHSVRDLRKLATVIPDLRPKILALWPQLAITARNCTQCLQYINVLDPSVTTYSWVRTCQPLSSSVMVLSPRWQP